MFIRIAATGGELSDNDVDQIQKDLGKLERRLKGGKEPYLDIHVSGDDGAPTRKVTLRLEYGPNQLVATAEEADVLLAVRQARERLLRQIEREGRGGHADHAKR
ncbi:MAG TPA: HPF/RaiA family ribosome-associated protein [Actinomycetota bacterium]|jgi:ribosome-associated translation inhibitor RaiA|nr:HPF/RaiA family ribosome-associated protein [Actinomycetota bacterium]